MCWTTTAGWAQRGRSPGRGGSRRLLDALCWCSGIEKRERAIRKMPSRRLPVRASSPTGSPCCPAHPHPARRRMRRRRATCRSWRSSSPPTFPTLWWRRWRLGTPAWNITTSCAHPGSRPRRQQPPQQPQPRWRQRQRQQRAVRRREAQPCLHVLFRHTILCATLWGNLYGILLVGGDLAAFGHAHLQGRGAPKTSSFACSLPSPLHGKFKSWMYPSC